MQRVAGLIEAEFGNAVTRSRGPQIATSEPCFITGQAFTVDGFQYN